MPKPILNPFQIPTGSPPIPIKLIVSTDYTVEIQESRSGDSASLRLGAAKLDSRVSKFFGALSE